MPKFDQGLSLLCWAFNEEQLIEDFILRADKMLADTVSDYEIVVVDDCSTDRTPTILANLQARVPALRVLRNARNRNVGYSCKKAIKAAHKPYLFWQTVDWSYDITMLRTFLELLRKYDVVAGVRRSPVAVRSRIAKPFSAVLKLFNIQHLTKRSDNFYKAVISVTNYCLIRVLFRMPLSDFQNVVFYRSTLAQSWDLTSDSSFLNPELLLRSFWHGARIVEVPISFIPRQVGHAKGTRFRSILRSISDILRFWLAHSPLIEGHSARIGSVSRLRPEQWEVL